MVQWLNANQGFIMSVLTACYVLCTLWIILDNRKERKIHLNREIVGKIYIPLNKDLGKLKSNLEDFELPPWRWESLKESYIAYELPERIFNDLQDFTLRLRRYENLQKQLQERLFKIVEEEEKKKVSQLGSKGIWSVCFEGKVGGKTCRVTLLKLLFWDETFDQYIERFIKETPDLANEKISGRFVVLNSSKTELTKEDFEQTNISIRKRINENHELQQLAEQGRTLCREAQSVKASLAAVDKD